MVSIVIPSKDERNLNPCLDSIYASQPNWHHVGHEIVVYDDGLRQDMSHRHPFVSFVPKVGRFIFSRAINHGVRKANVENDILILNDDTLIKSQSFLDGCMDILFQEKFKRYGILSPRILRNVGNLAQTHQVPDGEVLKTTNTICFVAALIRRSVWEKVGPMDQQFAGYGFEDDDYCRRVQQAGFSLGVFGTVVIDHKLHGTHNLEKLDGMTEYNRRLFQYKWGLS